MCVCLISLSSAWLGLWGTILLKPLSQINQCHKVANNPVANKPVEAALNATLFENSYCYSCIKAWTISIIWGPIVPQSASNAHTQHTHSWPRPQPRTLFMLLPGRPEFTLRLWSLAIWVKSLSAEGEQCYWLQPLAVNTHAHAHTVDEPTVATCPSSIFTLTHTHTHTYTHAQCDVPEQWNNSKVLYTKDLLKSPSMLFGSEEETTREVFWLSCSAL